MYSVNILPLKANPAMSMESMQVFPKAHFFQLCFYLTFTIIRPRLYIDLFVNISDSMVCRSTSKILDDPTQVADPSTDPAFNSTGGGTFSVTFNSTKTKLMTFYHHQEDPEFVSIGMNRSSL